RQRHRNEIADARPRSSRCRHTLSHSELLRARHSSRAASRHQCRPAAAPAKGDAHAMTRGERFAVAADTIFDGSTKHENAAVIIKGSDIARIVRQSQLPPDLEIRKLPPGAWLAPGFIDIQVNGGGDVLFNNSPTPEAIRKIAAAHRMFG